MEGPSSDLVTDVLCRANGSVLIKQAMRSIHKSKVSF
jgi:hypothetical protein